MTDKQEENEKSGGISFKKRYTGQNMSHTATENAGRSGFLAHVAGLRAVAIVLVLLFHLEGDVWTHGYLGVDVFLVIMGYLLWRGRLAHTEANSLVDVLRFAYKKIMRIVPPMTVVIVLTVLVGMFFMWSKDEHFLSKIGDHALLGKANMFLKNEFEDYFAQESAFIPLLHMWYLSVTLQVYLLWTVGNYMLQRFPKWVTVIIVAVVAAASLIYCYSFELHAWMKELGVVWWKQGKAVSYYQTLPRLWEVLAGGLVCVLPRLGGKWVWSTIAAGVGLVGIIAPGLVGVVPGLDFMAEWPCTLIVVASTLLVIRYLPESHVGVLLSNKPLVWLGGISFSVYLVHMPIFVYWRLWLYGHVGIWDEVGMLTAAVAVGWGYWWCVEKRRMSWWQVGLLWLAALGLCKAGRSTDGFKRFFKEADLSIPAYKEWQLNTYPELEEGLAEHINIYRSVFWIMNVKKPSYEAMGAPIMTIGDAAQKPDFVLMGDSHASHAYAGLDHLMRREKRAGVYLATITMPFHNCNHSTKNPEYKFYPEKEDAIFHWLEVHPELKYVIIEQWWPRRLQYYGKINPTGDFTNDMRAFLKRIQSMGRKVIIMGPVPEIEESTSKHYYKIVNIRNHKPEDVFKGCTREQYDRRNGRVIVCLRELEAEGLCSIIDPLEALGHEDAFPAMKINSQYMHDSHHMTPEFSIWMAERLWPQLREALAK